MGKNWQQLIAKAQELGSVGKLEEAQSIALEALAVAETLAPDDRRQGLSLEILTGILYQRKQWALSEPFLIRLLEMYRRNLGPDHVDTGTVLHNVALLYHGWGKLVDADAYYLQAVRVKSAHLQSEHPEMQVLTSNYAALRSVLVPLENAMNARPPAPRTKTETLTLTGQFKVHHLEDSEILH